MPKISCYQSSLRGSSQRKVALAFSFILVFLVCGLLAWKYYQSWQEDLVELPAVVGQSFEQAKETLASLGFAIKIEGEQELEFPEASYQVVEQRPLPGRSLTRGSEVLLFLEESQAMNTIPDVVGLTRLDAIDRLRAAGFAIKEVEKSHEDMDMGLVFEQEPKALSSYQRGAEVTIYISKSVDLVFAPQLVGLSFEQAKRTLAGLGLTFRLEGKGERVVEQQPPAGSKLKLEDELLLVLGGSLRTFVVPNFEGLTYGEALEMAASSGIVLSVASETANSSVIQMQEPGPGNYEKPQTVTLHVTQTSVVPNLSGLSLDEASVAIENAGLVLGSVNWVVGDKDNIVLAQSPSSGIEAPGGSVVSLQVSRATGLEEVELEP